MKKQRGVTAFTVAFVLLGTSATQAPPPAAAADCSDADRPAALIAKVPEFVNTIKPSEAVVDAFLSRLGPDARNGTVELDGRIVPSFVTSSGDGYAYAVGPTVVFALARLRSSSAVRAPARETPALVSAVSSAVPNDPPL